MYKNRQFSILFALLSLYLALLILNQLQILDYIIELIKKLDFLFLSAIIAFLFDPIINSVPVKNRAFRCTIFYFGLLILIALFFVVVIPILAEQSKILVQRYYTIFDGKYYERFFSIFDAEEWGSNVVSAVSGATTVISRITNFFLLYLASYFISLDLESILNWIKSKVKKVEYFQYFYVTCTSAVYHYIQGLCVDLLILFIAELILLWILGFAYPVTFALVTIVMNLIPYVGATMAQLLILLVDFNQYGHFRFELFVFGFILQQLESNFIQPYIFNKVLKLKPIVTLISILIFGYLFNFAGLILAPIFAVVVQLAYRSFVFANDKKTVGTWKNVWYNFEEIGEEDK